MLSSDSKAIALQKGVTTPYISVKLLTKRNKTSPLLNHIKGNTSRFGSVIPVLPSDIGKYLSSFWITDVVVVVFN